ncbi:MAG: hypothetical protein ACOCWA_00560 [Bacteroidota bacterium]
MSTGLLIIGVLLIVPLVYSLIKITFSGNYQENDIRSGSEDGFFKRFPGGIIEYYRNEFDNHRIVTSNPGIGNNGEMEFSYQDIEGVRKTVIYKIPLHHDPTPIYDYYTNEFKSSGFEILYSVYGEKLMGRPGPWVRNLYVTRKNVIAWRDLSFIMDGDIHCYISGMKKNGNKTVYASVFSANHYRNDKKTGVFIFITTHPVD